MRLTLVGIGTGNPDHLTRQGEAALRAADLLLLPRKGDEKAALADVRRLIATGSGTPVAEFDMPERDASGPYLEGVEAWHDAVARAWAGALARHPRARSAALMVWGDPSLYDSALRIARRLRPVPELEVVPGITSLQALTAAHRIPLNALGAPVLVTTGRRLREGWPHGADRIAVMLDGACAFRSLDPERTRIWWGAYLGMRDEVLDAGPLAEAGPRIVRRRAEARARAGWIMDVYLLERRGDAAGPGAGAPPPASGA